MEGLCKVIVAAGFESAHPVRRIAPCGQEKHGRVISLRAQRAADGEAVDLRQHDIQDYQSNVLRAEPVECLAAIGYRMGLVAFGAQIFDYARGEMWVVLDDEDTVSLGRQIVHADSVGATGHVST